MLIMNMENKLDIFYEDKPCVSIVGMFDVQQTAMFIQCNQVIISSSSSLLNSSLGWLNSLAPV